MTRPRFRFRQQQVAEQRANRVRRAEQRLAEFERAEQLSDETHIPEDNATGTLRIENGIAYLNGRSLGEIEDTDISDTITTGAISAENLRIGATPQTLSERLDEALNAIRDNPFPYRVRERLGEIQIGGVNAQPNSDYFTREQFNREYMSLFAPRDEDEQAIRGLDADHIYRAETEEDIVMDGVREELTGEQTEIPQDETDAIARLREELMNIGRNAARDVAGDPDGEALRTEAPATLPHYTLDANDELAEAIREASNTGGLIVGGNSMGRTATTAQAGGNIGFQGRSIRIDENGITAGRVMPENLEGLRIDNAAVGGIINPGTARTTVSGWTTALNQKRYVFDEEKVNTLMDTIRVVRAIMSNFSFTEEQIRDLKIDDLVRER